MHMNIRVTVSDNWKYYSWGYTPEEESPKKHIMRRKTWVVNKHNFYSWAYKTELKEVHRHDLNKR